MIDGKIVDFEYIYSNSICINKCREFYGNIASLHKFGYYCNHRLFVLLFGDSEGDRLWMHFVVDCDRNIFKLTLEYLNNEQLITMIYNIIYNEDNLKFASKNG